MTGLTPCFPPHPCQTEPPGAPLDPLAKQAGAPSPPPQASDPAPQQRAGNARLSQRRLCRSRPQPLPCGRALGGHWAGTRRGARGGAERVSRWAGLRYVRSAPIGSPPGSAAPGACALETAAPLRSATPGEMEAAAAARRRQPQQQQQQGEQPGASAGDGRSLSGESYWLDLWLFIFFDLALFFIVYFLL